MVLDFFFQAKQFCDYDSQPFAIKTEQPQVCQPPAHPTAALGTLPPLSRSRDWMRCPRWGLTAREKGEDLMLLAESHAGSMPGAGSSSAKRALPWP